MIIKKRNIKSYMFAFHLINNSTSNDQLVDEMLIPILKKIWKDQQVDGFFKKRKDFFEKNINR
jgi:hypothetical protein